jgi:hypothetical protein
MKKIQLVIGIILSFLAISCNKNSAEKNILLYESDVFIHYWYSGKAEINSYTLLQTNSGREMYKGQATLIFETEDFSKKKHVKVVNTENLKNKVRVMKFNLTKNFVTGSNPHAMMLSVFTPIDRAAHGSTLKVALSVQEWAGQIYTQMNLRGNHYNIKSHSHFEQDGDQLLTVKKTLLEDELWNIIRLDHQNLPIGNIEILPGLLFSRLYHTNIKNQRALAVKKEDELSYTYTVTLAKQEHKLTIEFEKKFPHKITQWKEEWNAQNRSMQTIAMLDTTMLVAYNHNP